MKFYNQFNPPKVVVIQSYDEYYETPIFTKGISDLTFKQLKIKKVNISDYINSFAESYDLAGIMERALNSGVVPVLPISNVDPVYEDVSEVPNNVPDALAKVQEIDQSTDIAFSKVPADLKGGKSKEEFYKTLSKDDLLKYIKEHIKVSNDDKEVK